MILCHNLLAIAITKKTEINDCFLPQTNLKVYPVDAMFCVTFASAVNQECMLFENGVKLSVILVGLTSNNERFEPYQDIANFSYRRLTDKDSFCVSCNDTDDVGDHNICTFSILNEVN